MKKTGFEFIRNKPATKKEINISFTQCQEKNKNKKTSIIQNQSHEPQRLAQIEISFWEKSISQLDEQIESLKSFLGFKNNQITLLECQLKNNPSYNFQKILENKKNENQIKINKIKEKQSEKESNLSQQIVFLSDIQNENEEFTIQKYQLKEKIDKLKNIIAKNQNDKKVKKNNNTINFNRIEMNDITNQYKGLMTTTAGELCKSRLGNKLLLSLNVDEINKHQIFDRNNLAYPVLKKKKIQFSYLGESFNTKKLGKKKINLNDFNNFKVNGFPDGMSTVY